MKKRIISLVLAVMMFATLVPTFAFASEETESNIITLYDFGNPANIQANNQYFGPSALAYEGKASSFKYIMTAFNNNGTLSSRTSDYNVVVNDDSRDLSAYKDNGTINVRFYSEAAGSKINFGFFKNDDFASYRNYGVAIKGGWQVYSVKLSEVYEKTGNKITFRLNDEGWNNLKNKCYKHLDTVYVDSVYIDTNPNSYYSNLGDDTLLVWDAVTYGGGTVATDNLRDGGLSQYSKWSSKGMTAAFRREMTSDESNNHYYNTLFNVGDYSWMNMWVYSPRAQDDGFNFIVYIDKGNDNGDVYIDGVKTETKVNNYPLFYSVKQVNWKGWKLISMPVPAGLKNQNVISCEFNIGGWTGNHTNCPDTSNLEIGFEGIWLSKEATSPQAQWEASNSNNTDTAITPAATDVVLVDFATDVPSGNKATLEKGNGRIYNNVARVSFESVTTEQLLEVAKYSNDGKVPAAAKGNLTVYGNGGNTTDLITGLSDDAYINAWIYNPEPKFSVDSTTSAEFVLAIGYYNGTGTSLTPVHIIANWTGWKLVSIPLKDVNENLITSNINFIYFAMNQGWYAVQRSSTNPKVTLNKRSDAQKAQGYVISGSNNVFGKASSKAKSLYNYIDVERVWISKGKPETEVNVTAENLSATVCSANTDIKLFNTNGTIGKANINAVSNLNLSAAAENVTITDSTAEFETLRNGAQYNVYVSDMYNSNGVKLPNGEYTFTVENYHVTKTEDNGSITVEMHGNVPEEYTAAVMVAAVYNKGTNTLADVEFAQVADGRVTASVEGFDEATQDIKFIFINGWNGLKPLETEIVK